MEKVVLDPRVFIRDMRAHEAYSDATIIIPAHALLCLSGHDEQALGIIANHLHAGVPFEVDTQCVIKRDLSEILYKTALDSKAVLVTSCKKLYAYVCIRGSVTVRLHEVTVPQNLLKLPDDFVVAHDGRDMLIPSEGVQDGDCVLFDGVLYKSRPAEDTGFVALRPVEMNRDDFYFNTLLPGATNIEQRALLQYNLDPEVGITIAHGAPGTGKTHIALLAALELMKSPRNKYNKILYTRTIQPTNRREDIAAVPGGKDEKLALPMQSLETALAPFRNDPYKKLGVRELVEAVPFAYMQGMTHDNTILVLDESQRCESADIEMILTRLGKNSKFFLCGDVSQTQNNLTTHSNGLAVASRLLAGMKGVKSITLQKQMRSPFVQEISRRFSIGD